MRNISANLMILLGTTLLASGCNVGPRVWIEDLQELTIPTAGLESLAVTTHNGDIAVDGQASSAVIKVVAKIRAGGLTEASAQDCRAAMAIVSQTGGAGHELTWKWTRPKAPDWGGSISFEVTAPPTLDLRCSSHNGNLRVAGLGGTCDLTTYNGSIDLTGIGGACTLLSHNGNIRARGLADQLAAETYNGGIGVYGCGPQVKLTTHNGAIEVDAADRDALCGLIQSYNGAIALRVGPQTSAELICQTYNGGISCAVPWQVTELTKSAARGRIGTGGGELTITTHNGGITIRPAGAK